MSRARAILPAIALFCWSLILLGGLARHLDTGFKTVFWVVIPLIMCCAAAGLLVLVARKRALTATQVLALIMLTPLPFHLLFLRGPMG